MDVEHFIAQAGNSDFIPSPVPMGTMWHLEFLAKNLAITAIVAAVALRYFYVQHQWRSRVQSEAKARIQALQSRIRPHFLFNSMNTIASLTRTSPELAEQVTEDLADLFRASLGDASVPVTLEREIEVCRQYLRIEEQRLGARVSTSTAARRERHLSRHRTGGARWLCRNQWRRQRRADRHSDHQFAAELRCP
jgi:hypothetical protein